jgi:hypothetical protein
LKEPGKGGRWHPAREIPQDPVPIPSSKVGREMRAGGGATEVSQGEEKSEKVRRRGTKVRRKVSGG